MMKTRQVVLRLALSVLSMIAGLGLPASAHAQTRLEAVYNVLGTTYRRSSLDNGATWTPYQRIDWTYLEAHGGGGFLTAAGESIEDDDLIVNGAPALVSTSPGRLVIVVRDVYGGIYWARLPDSSDEVAIYWPVTIDAGVRIGNDEYRWTGESVPGVSSHAPGRLDVFMVARRVRDGAMSLLHAYWDSGWRWEFLGSGYLTGSAAAISWGPGRIDVFVRSANNTLLHKWFDSGRWSPGFEDLGGSIVSSPSVTSSTVGNLMVFAVGTDRALHHRTFGWGWFGWENDGGVLGGATTPAVTTDGQAKVEAFVYAADRQTLFQRTNIFGVWTFRQDSAWPYHVPMTAIYWTP